ncbi:innexin-19-like [Babylonia areolata]|uniref:innexin-19-like n=1 Tax=Babylonia areolata TaxID=304850 RepID=UPI003FD4019B
MVSVYTMWRHDKSWVENFLSSWTPLLLAGVAVTSLLLRYVRDPITCHYIYPKANEYFTEYCFQETSIIMRSEEFTKFCDQQWRQVKSSDNKDPFETWPKQRTYHQWVPFALGIGAILCLLPHLFWRVLTALLWLDSHALVRALAVNNNQSAPGNSTGRHAASVVVKDSALVVEAGLRGGNWMLSVAALARKVVACVVCFLQLLLIVVWFKPPLGAGGDGEKRNLTSVNITVPPALGDVPLPVDPFFCSVETTQRQNVQTMTMLCLLPLNKMFVKTFVFLFYAFLLLFLLCLWDVFYWLGRLYLPRLRDVTLLRNLSISSQSEGGSTDSAHIPDFLQALGPDGRLVLALVADHCGPVVTLHFTSQLWKAFYYSFTAASGPAPLSPATPVGCVGGSANHDGADIQLEAVNQPPHTHDCDTAKLCEDV